ncbi:MAG: hypothetical protein LBU73_01585 [Helicobacteraceae bacterium]|nr:hypothetical protein [Helicobacteraceae bacterium]
MARFLPRREAIKKFIFGLPRYDKIAALTALTAISDFLYLIAVGAALAALFENKDGGLIAAALFSASLYIKLKKAEL